MKSAKISIETLTLPTYAPPAKEDLPIFAENRVHQRTTGNIYPEKVAIRLQRDERKDRDYTAVHLQNDYLDVWVLPEIGGRIFAAQDKSTGYDFFYRQHVIKPALIGALGNWISGGVEFNWPYHHKASGYMPCDYRIATRGDGSVACILTEREPVDRMQDTVEIILRADSSVLETRVRLTNRTPVKRSFLWWENAAVPVNENYQLFFPKDVTFCSFHYLDARASWPVAGDVTYNGYNYSDPRDISFHKNTRNATSYFAGASKYDFFGGYDHGRECGVVHIGNHHLSPGKKMFTWGYEQLSRSWEKALTDTDGQYAELMAGSYTDNQPNFSWLDATETKQFSQYWYPIAKIGTPDFANLRGAVAFHDDCIGILSTENFGECELTVRDAAENIVLTKTIVLETEKPVFVEWTKPNSFVHLNVKQCGTGRKLFDYKEEKQDELKTPPVKTALPLANEMRSADELYLAGVHVDQYRDPTTMPDVYWLEALKRDPYHAPSLIAMARYAYNRYALDEAKAYAEKAVRVLTQFNERTESGEAYYIYALILDALGETDRAYDYFYKSYWSADCVEKSLVKLITIDLRRGDTETAAAHTKELRVKDAIHPMLSVYETLSGLTESEPASLTGEYLAGKKDFFENLFAEPAQSALDIAFELVDMGQYDTAICLLENFLQRRPEQDFAMIRYTLAYLLAHEGRDYAETLRLAEDRNVGESYPFRLEEKRVLEFAVRKGSAHAEYLLGCLLYSRRHYAEAQKRFEKYAVKRPNVAAAHRCLAIALFSHGNEKERALKEMRTAVELTAYANDQMMFEYAALMDKMSVAPQEKIAELKKNALTLDNLNTELAKAYNQNGKPEKALEVLLNHAFIPCEGGEHAIADQYMFAHYQIGMKHMQCECYAEAKVAFETALTIPDSLGAGIWNPVRQVPQRFRIAECERKLGNTEAADRIFEEIMNWDVEFFSNMHLPELPFYQAMSAEYLGRHNRAINIMNACKRKWTEQLNKKDNGFFGTTPFFISFTDDPTQMRKAYYLYLLGLVDFYDGRYDESAEKLRTSHELNSDHLYAGIYAANVKDKQ